MFTLVRAIIYAALFIGLVLVYLSACLLAWTGVVLPETMGLQQTAGMINGTVGGVIAVWCVLTFAILGKDTLPHLMRLASWSSAGHTVLCAIRCTSVQAWLWPGPPSSTTPCRS